jgi:hypothetical protein
MLLNAFSTGFTNTQRYPSAVCWRQPINQDSASSSKEPGGGKAG